MTKYYYIVALMILFLSSNNAYSRSKNVSQLPNGAKNSCATCHVSNTQYSMNPFGKALKNGYYSGGNANWKATLAKLDSDGDGFTNGQELQDPEGLWTIGTTDPGDIALVTNPGLASSFPTGINEEVATNDIFIKLISGNPIYDILSFELTLAQSSVLVVGIYNPSGSKVVDLYNGYAIAGNYTYNWDLHGRYFDRVSNGLYYIVVESFNSRLSYPIVVIQ